MSTPARQTLGHEPTYIRAQITGNGVFASVCPRCGARIAFSKHERLLAIAERAHQCNQAARRAAA